MLYRHVAPPPALASFVDRYLLIHFAFDPTQPRLFKPYPARPEQYMTFTLEGYDLRQHTHTGRTERVVPNALFGQPVSRVNLYPTSSYKLFRVFFKPGAMFRLFGIPLSELTDTYIDTESFIGLEVRAMNEQLANATSQEKMIDLVNTYLLRKVGQTRRDAYHLDRVANLLLTTPTAFSLDWLADQACLGPRQFNRRFTERVGVGPKLYARLVRYYTAYQFRENNPTTDWLSVALRFGYTDVQHLGKDFREFAGVTPNGLLRETQLAPETVLQLR